jgi:hypothetical protein
MSRQGENNKLVQDFGLSTSRRQFVKGAAISAPIIAAVSSRPVWASSVSAVSGNLSGNLSQPAVTIPPYDGKSPGYWQGGSDKGARIDALPGVNRNTLFNSIFRQTTIPSYTASYSVTLLVAVQTGGNTYQPERFAAAAYLNSLNDPNYPYTPAQIVDFYGYYARGEITKDEIHATFQQLTHCGTEEGLAAC